MTRQRIYGSDVPFMAWMRDQGDLPSYSKTCGVVSTDVDCWIHRYMTEVDSIGTRNLQAIMFLEVKSRGGQPSPSQLDSLRKVDAFRKTADRSLQCVINCGVSVLRLSNLSPDDSEVMYWGRFSKGKLSYRTIDKSQLLLLMRFELHHDNLTPRPFRRHHKTSEFMVEERTPLGFTVQRPVIKRS